MSNVSSITYIILFYGICFVGSLVIETHPKSQTVKSGKSVRLLCVFDEEVKCVWKRNGRIIQIQGRYTMNYGTYDPKKRTRNCSIAIKNFGEVDVGNWSCGSASNSFLEGINSNIATLSLETSSLHLGLKNGLRCKTPTKSQTVLGNQSIAKPLKLKCTFNQKVKCNWRRNNGKVNDVVNITNRYQYKKGNGVNTKDCTIIFKTVKKEFDEGQWICSSMANDEFDSVKCAPITIKELKSKSPNDIT